MAEVQNEWMSNPGIARQNVSAGEVETMIKFIIKSVFWFAVVLVVLPERSPNQQSVSTARVDTVDHSLTTGTIDSMSEIRSLATRLQTVCEKNPDLCVSSLDNMSMVAAMLGYQARSFGSCSADSDR